MRLAACFGMLAGCHEIIPINERDPQTCAAAAGDEDGDCIANSDDNCPALANNAQDDGDADDVGDACDPEDPRGDAIAEFEPFDDATAAMRWRDLSPLPWTFEAGVVRHVDPGDTTGLLQRIEPLASNDTTIDARFIFTSWPGDPAGTMADIYIAVRLDSDANTENGHSCRIDPMKAATAEAIVRDANGVERGIPIVLPTIDMPIRIRLRRSPDRLRCEVTMGDERVVIVESAREGSAWPTSRHVGVDAPRAAVALDNVTLFVVRE